MPEFLFSDDKNQKPQQKYNNIAETSKPFLFCVLFTLRSLVKADLFQGIISHLVVCLRTRMWNN